LVKSATSLNGCSSESLRLAAVGLALIREIFPSQQPESDEATKLRLELMAELAEEIGEARFVRAVRDTIKISHRRWDCSVARVREMAGLRHAPAPTAAAIAWEWVMRVYLDHCRVDGNGTYQLEDKVTVFDGVANITPAPKVPSAIQRALRSMGGWAAIAEAYPEYIGAKYRDFKELYREDEAPARIGGSAELERVK
jgi:hypothetical protein